MESTSPSDLPAVSPATPVKRPAAVVVRDSGHQAPALDRPLTVLEFVSAHPEGVTRQEIKEGLEA